MRWKNSQESPVGCYSNQSASAGFVKKHVTIRRTGIKGLDPVAYRFWFSFIVFKSKKHRDEVNKKVMDEMNEKFKEKPDFEMPFDMQHFTYGGFEVAVEG